MEGDEASQAPRIGCGPHLQRIVSRDGRTATVTEGGCLVAQLPEILQTKIQALDNEIGVIKAIRRSGGANKWVATNLRRVDDAVDLITGSEDIVKNN